MDDTAIRKHMEELRVRLRTIEAEREVVQTLIRGYEGWLRLNGQTAIGQLALGTPAVLAKTQPAGPITIREAIRQVLQDAQGEPLTATEIWNRVSALGAETTAQDPVAMVDYTSYSVKGVQKAGKRTWRWIGGEFIQRGQGKRKRRK